MGCFWRPHLKTTMLAATQTRTVSVTTSYVALENLKAKEVSILNNTGANMLIRMVNEPNAGSEITLKDGQSVALAVVANANEIEIKAAAGASGVQIVVN